MREKNLNKRIEEYIRGLSREEFEKFIQENDQHDLEEESQPLYSEWSDKKIQLDEKYLSEDQIKSESSTSEISQEEIIMMSNIPTQISYWDTKECKKNYAGE